MIRSQFVFWPLFAAAGVIALTRGGRTPYGMFFILCGVLTFCLVFAAGVRLTTRVSVTLPRSYAVTGQTVHWRVDVLSRFFMPLPVIHLTVFADAAADGKTKATMSALPYRQASLRLEHSFACRGVYRLGIKRWRAPDYFALFAASGRAFGDDRISVLPRVIPLDKPYDPSGWTETDAFSPAAKLDHDGARPYEPGDSMRDIHWKLSAKTEDEFFTKKLRGEIPRPRTVVLDLTAITFGRREVLEDRLLETAFSLIKHLLGAGEVSVLVISDTVRETVIRSASDFTDFYFNYGLAVFGTGDLGQTLDTIDAAEDDELWLVTSHVSDGVLRLLSPRGEDLGKRGMSAWLLIADEPNESVTNAVRLAEETGAYTQIITRDLRQAEWIAGEDS